MEKETHTWETVHDTANRTMTHTFTHGFKVVINWGEMTLTTARNGEKITTVNFHEAQTLVKEYEALLLKIESDIDKLNVFEHERTNY